MALFWGNNDWLCDERDLMKIVAQVKPDRIKMIIIMIMIICNALKVPNIVVNNQDLVTKYPST